LSSSGRVYVENLGKCFKYYPSPAGRLLEWTTLGSKIRHTQNWALRGIHFEVAPGDAIGIVGANGSGKSTLLKLIRGTLRQSEGAVHVEGRIAALELGLGFHPDFTGVQNMFTAGALIGLDAAAIEHAQDDIEDFAEIGTHIDEPVRTYSSGMQMRLAFSIATALRPDILIIDEALAVGDAYFQQKCIARIRQFREEGTTLLFVSHDPGAVRTLCDRALLLEEGLLIREGVPSEILDYYNAIIAKNVADHDIVQRRASGGERGFTRSGDRGAIIENVDILDDSGSARALPVGARAIIRVDGSAQRTLDDLTVGISIRDRLGNEVYGTNTHHLGFPARRVATGDSFRADFSLPLNLGLGNYSLTVALHAGIAHPEGSHDWWDHALAFTVVPGSEPPFVGGSYLPASVDFRALRTNGELRRQ